AVLLTTGCAEEGTPVGPRAGVAVSDARRFAPEIAEGPLDHEAGIAVHEVECEQAQAIGAGYEVGPTGLPPIFPGPIAPGGHRQELEGLSPEELAVLTEREEDWKPLADHRVDMAGAEITASAVYLSSYAVVTID